MPNQAQAIAAKVDGTAAGVGTRVVLERPRVDDDAERPDRIADAKRVGQRLEALAAHLAVLRCGIDQVDHVDRDEIGRAHV